VARLGSICLSTTETTELGRYFVRVEHKWPGFDYEIFTDDGRLVACGFDILSRTPEEVLSQVRMKYGGKDERIF
jgi:hypothetical protein